MKGIACLALAALVLLPPASRASDGLPTAGSIDELVEQFSATLDELADEYFFEPGDRPTFDNPRFNRLVGYARIAIERARTSLDRGRVCHSVRWLYFSVRLLDRATNFAISANMSGSGYSNDLASLTTARVRFFLEDLTFLTNYAGTIPPAVTATAIALEEAGSDTLSPTTEGAWSPAVRYYTAAVCLIYRYL